MKKKVVITDRLVMIESFTCYQLHLHCRDPKKPEAEGSKIRKKYEKEQMSGHQSIL